MSECFATTMPRSYSVAGRRCIVRLLAEDTCSRSGRTGGGLGLDAERRRHPTHQSPRPYRAKPALQAASLPRDKPQLHVYGTGLGDLPTVLLERAGLERLYVHILNGALFALVLQLLDQRQWLGRSARAVVPCR